MKSWLTIATLIAVLTAAPLALSRPNAAPQRPQSVFYGHIKSMSRTTHGYEIRFDPAWWLTGRAAEQAQFEDSGSRNVANDYYIVDEGHRSLTYIVPATARVTVVGRAVRPVAITVAELSQIVRGRNPGHRRLLEPKAGFWIRVGSGYPGAVLSLEQQYQP